MLGKLPNIFRFRRPDGIASIIYVVYTVAISGLIMSVLPFLHYILRSQWCQTVEPNCQHPVWTSPSSDITMYHLAEWDIQFSHIIIFLVKHLGKLYLPLMDSHQYDIDIVKKSKLWNADNDVIPIISISANISNISIYRPSSNCSKVLCLRFVNPELCQNLDMSDPSVCFYNWYKIVLEKSIQMGMQWLKNLWV